MTTTVNISLPKQMYEDAKKHLKKRGYASLSEFFRQSLRDVLYPKVTVNGFTPEFEEEVLKAAAESRSRAETMNSDHDIDLYFDKLEKNSIVGKR